MENFTPFASTIGGVLIGLAAAALMFFNGRVAGISGILSGLFEPLEQTQGWQATFLGGMVAGGLAMGLIDPSAFVVEIERSAAAIAAAGFLVGFGTRLGSGCTSGHGVCGLARFSKRSVDHVAADARAPILMYTPRTSVIWLRRYPWDYTESSRTSSKARPTRASIKVRKKRLSTRSPTR